MNGLLLLDKPVGCTSHDVVARVRKSLNIKSVGHAGTLDPIASGLLVLLVGEGTKISNYILQGDKGYRVRVKLGLETDSWDISGKVLHHKEVNLSEENIRNVVESLQGELELPVPIFSAVKVGGKKLYEDAHKGKIPEAPVRKMKFYDIKLLEMGCDWFDVELRCTKGGYVRSWVQEVGRQLRTGACVESLRRLWSSPFYVEKAVKIEDIEAEGIKSLIPLSETLGDWPSIQVSGMDLRLLSNGQISHGLSARLRPYENRFKGLNQGIKVVSGDTNQLVSILTPTEAGPFSIARIFNC